MKRWLNNMKKTTIALAIRGEQTGFQRKEVEGYAFTLPTGHEAVVHKSHHNNTFWVVSIAPLGMAIVNNKMTRKDAIAEANRITAKIGKEDIDRRIKQSEIFLRSMSVK
jgi:hypothetical protein